MDIIHDALNPNDKDSKIILEIYRELYKSCGADFDKLVKESTIVDGRIQIPYMDYSMKHSDMENIINKILTKRRVYKWRRQRFIATILLGCSPKSIYDETI